MTLNCPNINLKKGNTGDTVKELQTELQKLGYYSGKIDSSFGPVTHNAVVAFQKRYGLKQDGIFGPVTCAKLGNVKINSSSASGADVFDCPKTSLSEGSKEKEKVKILQKYLNEWGYYNKTIDGDFGPVTKQAVIDFQKEVGVDADGIFGPKTCPYFVKKTKNQLEERNPNPYVIGAKVLAIPPHARYLDSTLTMYPEVVVEEEIEVEVETVTESTTTDDSSSTEETSDDTDTTTTETTKSTTTIKRYKIQQLGAANIANSGGLNCTGIKLQNGSSGDLVKTLQTGLNKMGYYNTTIDGAFGPKTEAAVILLQAASGITQDGIFGPVTCPYFNKRLGIDNTKITDSKKNYIIKDLITPQPNSDNDGLTHDCTLRTVYTREKLSKIQLMQRCKLELIQDEDTVYTLDGYVNDLKILQENNIFLIELSVTGYSAFLEQELPDYSGNKKQSEHLKDICKEIGLFLKLELNGLKDEDIELNKVTTTDSTGGNTSSGGGGKTVQMSNTDCNPNDLYETHHWGGSHKCSPPKCTATSKIARGNSSRQYAKDTASHNSTLKELVDYVDKNTSYEYVNGHAYADNKFGQSRCPEQMWTGSRKGNCANLARLMKVICDVNGYKCICCHIPGHFYNAVWLNNDWVIIDLCAKLHGLSAYGHANHGNQKPVGTWDNPKS